MCVHERVGRREGGREAEREGERREGEGGREKIEDGIKPLYN